MKTISTGHPNYVTRQELNTALNRQTEEIVGVIHDVMDRFDERFARLELRMDRLEKRMDNLEREVAEIKQDIRRLYDLAEKIIKQQEVSEQERLVMGHQLNRLDAWVHELAEKIGVKLTP